MEGVEDFQFFVTAKVCHKIWLNFGQKSFNTSLPKGMITKLFLAFAIFEELAIFFFFFRAAYADPVLSRLVFVGDLWRDKKEHLVPAWLRNGGFKKLCKIQLGILTCHFLRKLSVEMLFSRPVRVFAHRAIKIFRIRFWI